MFFRKCVVILVTLLTNIALAEGSHEFTICPESRWDKIEVLRDGEVIHEIVPEHEDKVGKATGVGSAVVLLYDMLINRGSWESQPELFDDITGDGNPNILVLERPKSYHKPPHLMAIRFFSIQDGEVVEFKPYVEEIGEIIYFDDFNDDGVAELVLTDHERHFLYSKSGMPISRYVLVFDSHRRRYLPATRMAD